MSGVDWELAADALGRDPNVVGAWAFGSAQRGEVRPGGDVDVAVLFRSPPDLDELSDLRADLQEALGFDEIDLVPLNGASSVLRFEALSGPRIFCRDPQECAAFASLAAREYEDDMAVAERGLRLWQELRP